MGSERNRMIAIIKDPQHFKRVVESVQVFNLRQDYMDLCFVCARGHRVFAHKLLLCSVSTQMKEMFLELPDNIDIITIHLPDIEARILRLIFDFLYEGSLKLVNRADYEDFNNLKDLLGIVLHRSSPSERANQQQPEAPPSSQAKQPIQPQAVFYVQAPGPNSQGQMQYVFSAPATMSQGQMMQMSQATALGQLQVAQAAAPGQMMQVTQGAASGQMMQVAQAAAPGQMMQVSQATAPGQMMQVAQATAPGQMMQVAQAQAPGQVMQVAAPNTSMAPQGQIMQMAPANMSQANGQMVQGVSQVVSTTIQQNNMMQVAPQNNTQVVPMVAGNQMVQCSSQMVVQAGQPTMTDNNQMQSSIQKQVQGGSQMVQCSSQVVVQAGQPMMTNNNQMQSNIQNQAVQPTQRSQYVMASSANQMTTSRVRAQYTQPQTTPQQRIAARSRAPSQVTQPTRNNAINSVAGSAINCNNILAILMQENDSNPNFLKSSSAQQLREVLEQKLGVDLSNEKELVEQVISSFLGLSGKNEGEGQSETAPVTTVSVRGEAERPAPARVKAVRRRKKRVSLSDDENDEDFNPRKAVRRSRKK